MLGGAERSGSWRWTFKNSICLLEAFKQQNPLKQLKLCSCPRIRCFFKNLNLASAALVERGGRRIRLPPTPERKYSFAKGVTV